MVRPSRWRFSMLAIATSRAVILSGDAGAGGVLLLFLDPGPQVADGGHQMAADLEERRSITALAPPPERVHRDAEDLGHLRKGEEVLVVADRDGCCLDHRLGSCRRGGARLRHLPMTGNRGRAESVISVRFIGR